MCILKIDKFSKIFENIVVSYAQVYVNSINIIFFKHNIGEIQKFKNKFSFNDEAG